MAVSNVYYTNMRTTLTENLLQKLERLVKKAGMMDIDFNNKYPLCGAEEKCAGPSGRCL